MNEHSLTKLFLVTNMHLYIDPKRGFKKISNFVQVHHFCSKQAVQKQWSLAFAMALFPTSLLPGDHLYITSAKGLGGWGQKIGHFC